jgi:predicted nucleotidyltransferase component of viral defense system
MSFEPKLSVLPEAQRLLWLELRQVPRRFVLYGGTALALRLGHRQSEDFDFFTDAPMPPDELLHVTPLLKEATVRQVAPNTLTVEIGRTTAVKLSFFGLNVRRVHEAETTADGVLQVASLLDLAAFKVAVLPQRIETKDYLDVYALLENGMDLKDALGAASAVYGERFNPCLTLKALAYFKDGNLHALPDRVKAVLRKAAAEVQQISQFEPLPGGIAPP